MNFDAIIDGYKDEMIDKITEIVKIRSVEGEAKEGMPFGKEVDEAFKYALNLSQELGFEIKNVDGYGGHAEYGEGDELVGVLVHLDIVPEGNGWSSSPFDVTIKDGKMYGRGVSDNKGPAIASLYALKALKESGVQINKKIRIIFGLNEETRWQGLDYYFKKEKSPDMAFVPDADFPIIYAEKGILDFFISKEFKVDDSQKIRVTSLDGGNAMNSVPDICEAVLKIDEEDLSNLMDRINDIIEKNNFDIIWTESKGDLHIKSSGTGAHGSMPESGFNAISQMVCFLSEILDKDNAIYDFVKFYKDKIGMEYNGQSLGCDYDDDVTGKLTLNVGTIELEENEVKIGVDVRYPVKIDKDLVIEKLESAVNEFKGKLIIDDILLPKYIPLDSPLAQTLLETYRECTGDYESQPMTMGGATYARVTENAVAFGGLFPGRKETAHQNDEYIHVVDLIKMTKIFAKAMYKLTK
ncbi:dipeptidase PepV [Wukongibacter baidiensis]|uniref:dipeptidase PepV n=1 Tax=Wukongibacter baidiensis TaxID=1723361 RepID=UPI003D7F631D